jgi:ABC-2 type transport system ATP-binding protein
MPAANGVAIETRGLGKSYGDEVALKALDLTVTKNSVFGFLGPNGAGKTTTIKLLLGLIFPTCGGATVFGHDIVRESLAIRSRIGYLPQNPQYYDYMTARQILHYTLGFYLHGPTHAIKRRVEATLELVGLADKADRRVKGFSGGELQRVGIGQAQVHGPDLLILDEPAASLDPQGRRDVLGVIERLREHGTVFYSTHILDDVQKVGDTVAILNHGELVAHGPIGELLSGSDGTIYTVTMKGNVGSAYARVSQQPWVLGVEVHQQLDHLERPGHRRGDRRGAFAATDHRRRGRTGGQYGAPGIRAGRRVFADCRGSVKWHRAMRACGTSRGLGGVVG